MMKITVVSSIFILLISGISFNAASNQYQTEQLSYTFSTISIEEKDGCSTIAIDGTNQILVQNDYYTVPTRIETITFPKGTYIESVQCNPTSIKHYNLEKTLKITPEPVMMNDDAAKTKDLIREPNSLDKWFSFDIGSGIIENERCVILNIELYPVRYEQTGHIIQFAGQMDIQIRYIQPSITPTKTMDDEYDLLIISPAQFSEEIDPLVAHKIERGIRTRGISLDDIFSETYFPIQGRDQQEQIKYFIKNAIEEWGITSVLLVGGLDEFPTRMTHIYVSYFDVDEPFPSDLYYADIYDEQDDFSSWDSNQNDIFGEYDWGDDHQTDEIDLYPDINIGRLACINEEEVTTSVNKIITYETNKAWTQGWFTNLVVIGADTFTDDTLGVSEGEYINQIVIDTLEGFIPSAIWDSNGRLSAPAPRGLNEIYDAINEGCGFIDFSGHGAHNMFATHPNGVENVWLPKPWGFDTSHVAKLSNGDKLPIIVLGACSTCKYDVNENCLGWSFLSNPNGGGIGSFGVTTFGYANGGGKQMSEGFIEEMTMNIFESYVEMTNNGAQVSLGDLWNNALINYISPMMEVRDYATIESFQPFGDPTLQISEQSHTPAVPQKPTGPTQIEPGTIYTFSSSTTDIDGDDVYYLFDWGDGNLSGWIGPYRSGETAGANHSWEEKGRYSIRTKAKDVHGIQSDWSDALIVSKPKIRSFNILDILGQRINNGSLMLDFISRMIQRL
jgi:hypothetical protein